LAVDYNFTKGRKGNNVVAACLYLVCHQENTSHFLIDFADYLNTNVYQLGATFLRLLQTLHIPQTEVPLVDPALYLARFAARLDFEDDTPAVIRDAERLVKRMQRDWIQVGRRPAGICAACLFIAGRMHGHRRAFRELAMVVKICETTLRRRLQEFKATASGQLSVQDFQTISLEHDADPPVL
ncbi:cyclin-like protein, partial [Caulochytrium protostelioides]